MARRPAVALVAACLGLLIAYPWIAQSSEEREIRRRIDGFVSAFNTGSAEGLGTIAHAARLGGYFTEDVEVELGRSSMPIRGRETVIGMAARLQPRTTAYSLALRDVTMEEVVDGEVEVLLTAVIRHRPAGGSESLDAREFSVRLRRAAGQWQVSRVVAVDTLR